MDSTVEAGIHADPNFKRLGDYYHRVHSYLIQGKQPSDKAQLVEAFPFVTEQLMNPHTAVAGGAVEAIYKTLQLPDDDLAEAALDAVRDNKDQIAGLATPDGTHTTSVLRVLREYGLWRYTDTDAKALFETKVSDLITHIDSIEDQVSLLPTLLEAASSEQRVIVEQKLKTIVVESLSQSFAPDEYESSVLVQLLDSSTPLERRVLESVILEEVKQYLHAKGFDADTVINLWKIAGPEKDLARIITRNLSSINAFEALQPGAAARIRKQQNVANFGRYPLELLLDQEVKEGDTRQLIHIVTAASDHNGAFMHDMHHYERMMILLKDIYRFKIIEFSNAEELDKFVGCKEEDVGTEDFLIMGVHGSEYAVHPGDGEITIEDFEKSPTKLGFARLKPGGILILASCSTGYINSDGSKEGIGRALSRILPIHSIGPEAPAAVSSIDWQLNDDKRLHNVQVHYVTEEKDPFEIAKKGDRRRTVPDHRFFQGEVVY